MAALLRVFGVGGSSIPNFEYTLGEQYDSVESPTLRYKLRHGTRNEDKSPVSIFEFHIPQNDEGAAEIARNACKKAKTIMVPGVLRCFDAVEHNKIIYIATEECLPLATLLEDSAVKDEYYEDNEKYLDFVAYGIHTVCQALLALHKNNLCHNNVNLSSVFVTKSGSWRLAGLEFVCGFNEEHSIYRRYQLLLSDHRRPPEAASSVQLPAVHVTDAWGVGVLIYEVFNSPLGSVTRTADMKATRSIPRTLTSGYTGLLNANPKMRSSLTGFLRDTEFITGNKTVEMLLDLEELSWKEASARDSSCRRLSGAVNVFTLRARKYIVLPKLSQLVELNVGSASALEPLLQLGALLSPDDFALHVAPTVVKLFAAPDHFIRSRLLSTASDYAKFLPATLVCEQIWPHYVTGFSNRNADLRELSVRGLVHFAPLLNEKILANDVGRLISALQQDSEGPIRTNATICLGMIAEWIPESARTSLLANGFGRMLHDPFLPSKLAAIRSTTSTKKFFAPKSIAEQMIPAISRLTIDAVAEVREAALQCHRELFFLLEENHRAMSVEKIERSATPTDQSAAAHAPAQPQAPAPQQTPPQKSSWSLWRWGASSSAELQTTAEPQRERENEGHTQPPPKPKVVGSVGEAQGWDAEEDPFAGIAPPLALHKGLKSTNQKVPEVDVSWESAMGIKGSDTTTSSQATIGVKPPARRKKGFGGASKID